MLTDQEIKDLKKFAIGIRKNMFLEIATLGVGHVGGSASVCELMACLYGHIMNVRPEEPKWPNRDRFIMSKGHAGPTMYAALAMKGYFPVEELKTLNKPNTNLPSHTDRLKTPGVDMTTGSLGQGVSSALGIALACKLEKRQSYIYCLVGDGECQEGQVWEGMFFGAHYKLNNFMLFVDNNKRQLDGTTEECMSLGNLEEKFKSFGWYVQTVTDGHDVDTICNAVNSAKEQNEKPSVIILNTIKAKDCPAAERVANNHNMTLTMEDYKEACVLLDKQLAEIN